MIYRFTKAEIEELVDLLDLETLRYYDRRRPSPQFALYATLIRLYYPSKWIFLTDKFGRSPSYLSSVFTDVVT